jgi:prefoldin subunit 5
MQLKNVLEIIKEHKLKEITSRVNIGMDFYVQAKGNVELITVETGVEGLSIEMTVDEALEYITKEETLLNDKIAQLTDRAANIRAHINTVRSTQFFEALNAIQNMGGGM